MASQCLALSSLNPLDWGARLMVMEGGSPQDEVEAHVQSHDAADVGPQQQHSPRGDSSSLNVSPDATDNNVVTWEASEYIHHQKTATWYLGLAVVTAVLCVLIYIFLDDWFSIAVIVLMSGAVGVYARREPRVQRYSISGSALSVGEHHYHISEFASYQIADEGVVQSATFIPLKRFMPPVSVYFLPQDGEKIMAVLGSVLPREEHQPDFVDRLMRRVRF